MWNHAWPFNNKFQSNWNCRKLESHYLSTSTAHITRKLHCRSSPNFRACYLWSWLLCHRYYQHLKVNSTWVQFTSIIGTATRNWKCSPAKELSASKYRQKLLHKSLRYRIRFRRLCKVAFYNVIECQHDTAITAMLCYQQLYIYLSIIPSPLTVLPSYGGIMSNSNKTAKLIILATGSITTSIVSAQSFNRICHVAPMCTSI